MALPTYKVKWGDTLTKIANGSCGKNVASSIAGNTVAAKIDTLVKLNNIANRDVIYVNQVLKLSNVASTSSSSTSSTKSAVPVITDFGLQSQDTTGRAMFVAWEYDRENVKNYKVRWMYYAENMWQIGNEPETTSYEKIYCNSTYNAPERATKVKVAVLAKSKEKNDQGALYWYDVPWSAEKIYDFADNPPFIPSTPSIEIKDLTLTITIDNIDAVKMNAEEVEFEIVKNNSAAIGGPHIALINTVSNYVSYMCTVEPGAEYKVRARCKKGSKVSSWTDFSNSSGTKPSAPEAITACRANSYEDGKVTAYLEWTPVVNAETYTIEYATDIDYFDGTDQTNESTGIKFNHFEISSLTIGEEYFFRVKAVNTDGESDWSEIKSTVLGTTPVAPTTWSSATVAVVGEPLNLYWVHNSEDGSSQTYAELRLYIDGELQLPDITIQNTEDPNERDKTSVYAIDTTDYPEGTEIKWQVRTAGITKVYGEWSIPRIVNVYAEPILALSVTTNPNGTGDIIDTLTSFPFYIYAMPGPKTQAPIGYHLKITANEFYETVDDTGRTKTVNKGDDIYSKYFDISDALEVEMNASTIDIEADIEYTITCLVTMNSGLTAETSHNFRADWDDVTYNINANISIDNDTYTASITPFSENENGELVEDLTLSVYRREYDGSFTEIATNIPNTNNVSVSDPHPALDYARYRIIGKTISTGAISFYDLPGVKVGCPSIIIQWNEDWNTFGASDEYSAEKPAWSGSLIAIPYNVDVSDSHDIEVELIEYAGRKHPVSYYGTQLGESATWTVEIPKYDKDLLYAIRRLATWTGDVYVREPSGKGYWANVSVSYSQAHKEVTIPVTFSITRVEGGI